MGSSECEEIAFLNEVVGESFGDEDDARGKMTDKGATCDFDVTFGNSD